MVIVEGRSSFLAHPLDPFSLLEKDIVFACVVKGRNRNFPLVTNVRHVIVCRVCEDLLNWLLVVLILHRHVRIWVDRAMVVLLRLVLAKCSVDIRGAWQVV